MAREGLAHEERAVQVHGHDAAPGVVVEIEHGADSANARGVDQAIQVAEALDGSSHGGFHLRPIGHVRGQRKRAAAAEFTEHLLDVCLLEIDAHHRGTLGVQPAHASGSDAAAGTRDDDRLAFEACHVTCSHPSSPVSRLARRRISVQRTLGPP